MDVQPSNSFKIVFSEKGRNLILRDGFKYGFQKTLKSNVARWSCTVKDCKGYIKTVSKTELTIVVSHEVHSHEPQDESTIIKKSVQNKLKRKAVEDIDVKPSKLLLEELLASQIPDLKGKDIERMRKAMYSARKSVASSTRVSSQHDVVEGYKLGELVIEGKTKKVWDLPGTPGHVLVQSKDRITAGDGAKAHDLEGKAAISNQTNGKVFEILNTVGVKTAYVKGAGETSFIARKCAMIPIEWVTRRLATGSFLKRHPGVPEGFRFNPPLQETFYKDDANHDPQWSEEQIVSAQFKLNGVTIGQDEVDIMRRTTVLVFEILEKAWATRDCALIDMKIEFGIDSKGEILVADVIDSDSWRLWPSGDKRLMKDKQVYRNLTSVTQADLDTVKRNFKWVVEQLDHLTPPCNSLVVVLMGSPSDEEFCNKIARQCKDLSLPCHLRVTSAHKGTEETLKIVAQYEGMTEKVVFIAVAGRSNGLGPVLSGNTCLPVINCPPVKADNVSQDVWSSLNLPSGLSCTTTLYPESAALAAAQIHALHDYILWSRLRVKQLNNFTALKMADKMIRNMTM